MEWEEQDFLTRLRNDPRIVAVLVALVGVAAVFFVARSKGSAEPPPTEPTVAATSTTVGVGADPVVPADLKVVVHVVGAVRHAGVVTLPTGSRVTDAIDAAGGAGPNADLERLNLAALLADGERVAVPRVGEALAPEVPIGSGNTNPADPASPDAPINLNTATAEQLESLPGIGPSLAAAIIDERDRSGGFETVDDLERVPGIGEQRLADIRDLVVVS